MSKFKHDDWVIRKSDGLVGQLKQGQCISMNGIDCRDKLLFFRDGWYNLIPRGERSMTCIWGYAFFEDDDVELFKIKVGDQVRYSRQLYNPDTNERKLFTRDAWVSEINKELPTTSNYVRTTFIIRFEDPINFGPLFKDCCELKLDEIEIYECSKKIKNA